MINSVVMYFIMPDECTYGDRAAAVSELVSPGAVKGDISRSLIAVCIMLYLYYDIHFKLLDVDIRYTLVIYIFIFYYLYQYNIITCICSMYRVGGNSIIWSAADLNRRPRCSTISMISFSPALVILLIV